MWVGVLSPTDMFAFRSVSRTRASLMFFTVLRMFDRRFCIPFSVKMRRVPLAPVFRVGGALAGSRTALIVVRVPFITPRG